MEKPKVYGVGRLISRNEQNFLIEFPYSLQINSAVRKITGRQFDGERRRWKTPKTSNAARGILELVEAFGFRVEEDALDELAELLAEADLLLSKSTEAATDDFELTCQLGEKPFPYQVAGVAYALTSRRCFISDEMGLGKTAQALITLEEDKAFPAVVVCPASLKANWKREVKKWIPNRHAAIIENGKTDIATVCKFADIIIVNYEVLAGKPNYVKGKEVFPAVTALNALGLEAIVLDESRYVKNLEALRTKACIALGHNVSLRLCLDGTPVSIRPRDLVGQLKFLQRLDDFGGEWTFLRRYCDAKKTFRGWDFNGASNTVELNQKLRETCYIRRLKANVLTELPDKSARTVFFDVNLNSYKRAVAESVNALGVGNMSAFDMDKHISQMKKQAAIAKLPAVIEWVQEFLDSGRKLVLFAWHKDVVAELKKAFPKVHVSVTGETSNRIDKEGTNDRQRAVDAFQNDPKVRLFIGNIKAAGSGLTLTAASDVAFVEFMHNPADHEQAEDRVHRIGQHDAVTAWYLVGEGTIDEDVIEILGVRQQVMQEVSDGKFASDKNRTVMKNILKRLRQDSEEEAAVV